MPKKLTIEKVREYVESKGCKLISTVYISNREKLELECICGEHFEKSFDKFKNGNQTRCTSCTGKEAYTLENVKDIVNKKGCKLLSSRYINRTSKLEIECSCGNIFERSLASIMQCDKLKCDYCNNTHKYTYSEVKRMIENEGCELLSKEYISNKDDLLIKCSCGNIFTKRLNNFLCTGFLRCYECALEANKGENHYNYDNTVSDEHRENVRLYPEYKEWRRKVYERDNFTCVICGKHDGSITAHHKDGYGWFVEGRTDINNGVTLCKSCHKEFHKIYGNKHNTKEQFEEFKKSFKLGE